MVWRLCQVAGGRGRGRGWGAGCGKPLRSEGLSGAGSAAVQPDKQHAGQHADRDGGEEEVLLKLMPVKVALRRRGSLALRRPVREARRRLGEGSPRWPGARQCAAVVRCGRRRFLEASGCGQLDSPLRLRHLQLHRRLRLPRRRHLRLHCPSAAAATAAAHVGHGDRHSPGHPVRRLPSLPRRRPASRVHRQRHPACCPCGRLASCSGAGGTHSPNCLYALEQLANYACCVVGGPSGDTPSHGGTCLRCLLVQL